MPLEHLAEEAIYHFKDKNRSVNDDLENFETVYDKLHCLKWNYESEINPILMNQWRIPKLSVKTQEEKEKNE